MILVFNKTDVQDASFAKEWMTDFEAFQSALQKEADNSDGEGGSGYMGSLMNSMSLVLDEFYAHLDVSVTTSPPPFYIHTQHFKDARFVYLRENSHFSSIK